MPIPKNIIIRIVDGESADRERLLDFLKNLDVEIRQVFLLTSDVSAMMTAEQKDLVSANFPNVVFAEDTSGELE